MSGETGRLHSNEVKDLSFQRLSLSIPVESKNYKAINEFLRKVCNLQDGSILEPNLQELKKEEPILKKDESNMNKNNSKSDDELFNFLSELIQDSRDIPTSKSRPTIKSRNTVNSRDSNSRDSNSRDSYSREYSREYSGDSNNKSNPKSKDSNPEPIMKSKITKSNELLPNIVFPEDIWLMDIISIKDIQIKTSILMEIIKMINTELLGEKDLSSIETSMNYYVKLLMAYKVYDVPVRVSSVYTPPDFSLKEEDDEDSHTVLKPTATYNSTHSQSAPNINQPLAKRISGISRERDLLNSSKKRLLTFLGHDSSSSYSDVSVNDEKPSFMTKSRIYNKLKKHRDLSSSINSNSSASLLSNRSSVMTTSSVNSNNTRRRASSTAPTDINESRLLASRQIVPPAVVLTLEQRIENRKYKHEYYIQLCSLLDVCNKMISFLNHNETHSSNVLISSSKLVKLMEFIKTKVWKFIVIDISQMILDYAKLKVYEW